VGISIRALAEGDDRSRFRSGSTELDDFFRRFAEENQFRHHIGVSYVAVHEVEGETAAPILGFVTVAPATLDADALPNGKSMPPYPIPVLRVARLATDRDVRGMGIGRALLRFAFELAERQRDEVGCAGILVDAKPESVEFYSSLGFVPLDTLAGEILSAPRPVAMYLPLGSIPRRP